MPLKIIREDIVNMTCDAIVNPTDPEYSHRGGVDLQIHAAAGEALYQACLTKGGLTVGSAVITPGFALPAKYVIHTVGPVWQGGDEGEEAQLRSCYTEALRLAMENGCQSVAFPLISSGRFGFPKDRVLRIAMDAIAAFLFENELFVYLVVFDKTAYTISEQLFSDITDLIDGAVVEHAPTLFEARRESRSRACYSLEALLPPRRSARRGKTLEEMLEEMDVGFAELLFRLIDEKGMTDVECYKRANVDKKTFSKIKCNKNYKPSKVTAVSFAIALRLSLEETNRLLGTVGMTLSRSNKFDVIITYFVTTGNYKDIFDVNEVLYQFDQVTLGV